MMQIDSGTIKRIHVNQLHIKANASDICPQCKGCANIFIQSMQCWEPCPRCDGTGKNLTLLPVLTVKTSKGNFKGNRVQVMGPSELVYSPDRPLDCGAKVWVETTAAVGVLD